ncbi:hypothetical protein Ancab_035577 [Ancistrocladus abbreviatus]
MNRRFLLAFSSALTSLILLTMFLELPPNDPLALLDGREVSSSVFLGDGGSDLEVLEEKRSLS